MSVTLGTARIISTPPPQKYHFLPLTLSLYMDTLQLYYRNLAYQYLYHQLIQHPTNIVPLIDLVLG